MKTSRQSGRTPVTHYELRSADGVRIVASTADPLSLSLDENEFSGANLRVDRTDFGLILTIGLDFVPDSQTTTLSVMLPHGNRPAEARSITIQTFSVKTIALSNIAGPDAVDGQIQEYETQALTGNAW